MTDLEKFRLQRQSIRQKHAKVLNTIQKGIANETSMEPIRDHPRWKELVEKNKIYTDTSHQDLINDISLTADVDQVFGPAYIPSESTIRNDYSQRFIDTKASELPGNAVKNPFKTSRFEEYPKLRNLIDTKAKLLDEISIPPTYLQADLLQSIKPYTHGQITTDLAEQIGAPFHLSSLLPIKYDVVIIDPPLEAYEWESIPTNGEKSKQVWSWEQIAALPIPQIMAKESFIFFWVGSGASDGLERGREVLNKWGFRRCEDIVWIRTNSNAGDQSDTILQEPSSSAFHRTAEHCLMGIRGTVRRSTDTRFVHCNIDTDVILWPGEAADEEEQGESKTGVQSSIDMRSKPPEMMDLIENFCLGTRRLELFGRNRNLRRGWLTVGLDVGPDRPGWKKAVQGTNACAATPINGQSNNSISRQIPVPYHKEQYDSAFYVDRAGCTLAERANLVPYDEKIDDLRPKSPKSTPNQRRERTNIRQDSAFQVNTPMGGAYISPSNVHMASAIASTPGEMQMGSTHHESITGVLPQPQTSAPFQQSNPGGAGLSGLGAGGRSVVSVPSGSELLSGAQASVMLGQGQRPTNASAGGGPSGLSRRTRRGA